MSKRIQVDGELWEVSENLGYNHDVGGYVKMVLVDDREKAIVRQPGGKWRFWQPRDRVGPLVDAVRKGWPRRGADGGR